MFARPLSALRLWARFPIKLAILDSCSLRREEASLTSRVPWIVDW